MHRSRHRVYRMRPPLRPTENLHSTWIKGFDYVRVQRTRHSRWRTAPFSPPKNRLATVFSTTDDRFRKGACVLVKRIYTDIVQDRYIISINVRILSTVYIYITLWREKKYVRKKHTWSKRFYIPAKAYVFAFSVPYYRVESTHTDFYPRLVCPYRRCFLSKFYKQLHRIAETAAILVILRVRGQIT